MEQLFYGNTAVTQLSEENSNTIKKKFKIDQIEQSEDNTQETYNLKSLNCPPKIKEMVLFEKKLWNLANKLKFLQIKINFQICLDEYISR